MFADSEFTRKSGEYGTNMFSVPGRRTTYQYQCFSDKYNTNHHDVQAKVFESVDKEADERQRMLDNIEK